MTLLEFVCHKLLGKPEAGSCWRCPYCDSSGPSFSVRPPKPGKPVKFKCHRCLVWGDEFDLLRHFYADEGYSLRRLRLQDLRAEWEALAGVETPEINYPGSDRREPGSGRGESAPPDPNDLEEAFADFISTAECEGWKQTDAWQVAHELLNECQQHDITLADLVNRWQQHCQVQRDMQRRVTRRLRNPNRV